MADVKWHMEAPLNVLRNVLPNELKDSLQDNDLPDDLIECVKWCTKRESQLRASATESKSG
jgi:hypothetical protein